MNRDFEDEVKRSGERRSRKNPQFKTFDMKEEPGINQAAVQTAVASQRSVGAMGSGNALTAEMEEQLARKKRRRRMIIMIVAECCTLALIFGYAYFLKFSSMIQRPPFEVKNIQNTELDIATVEKMKGYWTIAVFGVDSRDKALTKSTNADVNIIANINQDTGEIKLVSVYRDSYLSISEDGSYNKINMAYFQGGPQQAVSALNRNLDLNITDFVTFNWKAVADAINILGGVDIELSKAEFYYINSFITETVQVTGIGSNHLKSAGMNHLDGVQAVAYARLRMMDTDYARTERQRKVIAQAFEKAKKADFETLRVIIGTVFPQIATSVGVDDLVMNAKNISKYYLGETTGFPQARGDANMGKKGACVIPQTLESNVIQLHNFLFGDEAYMPSALVKKYSAKISADSGMYKEGKYVDKVGTEGGVIQPPKTTAAKSETEKTSEATRSSEDESTKETTKKAIRETDESGNPIETTTASVKPGVNPGAAETDADGNPVETGTTAASQPGGATAPTTGAARPGSTAPDTAAAPKPGSTAAETTASNRPGETSPTTSPTTGSANEPAAVPNFPGASGTGATVDSNGPGGTSAAAAPTEAVVGTVSAPGQ